jgi:hypothetical protein
MLLRLSRACFFLAAAVAAAALWLPTGQETLLTDVALVASVAAFLAWRQGVRQRTLAGMAAWGPSEVPALDDAALRDAATMIEHVALAAPNFEAALHVVGRLLKSELGAREVTVHQVLEVGPTQARVARLIEFRPALRFDERWLRLESTPLGRCIAQQSEQGEPPGDVAVPIRRGGQVAAVLELAGIGMAIETAALARLLALSRLRLEAWTWSLPTAAAPSGAVTRESVGRGTGGVAQCHADFPMRGVA